MSLHKFISMCEFTKIILSSKVKMVTDRHDVFILREIAMVTFLGLESSE